MVHSFALMPPRHAFSSRDRARAGDVWRLFQEGAVQASAAAGWGPDRLRETGVAFVVRSMVAVHHREIRFGEEVAGQTWVSSFKKRVITHREIRLADRQGPIASTTQEWVHLRNGRVQRAGAEVLESFRPRDDAASIELPAGIEAIEGREHVFSFQSWHTQMDPIGHANHPAYVDWVDEAISRVMQASGLDPVQLVPVAERVRFRRGIVAPEAVRVMTRLTGRTEDGAVLCAHRILGAQGELAATATTVRTLAEGGSEALFLALH